LNKFRHEIRAVAAKSLEIQPASSRCVRLRGPPRTLPWHPQRGAPIDHEDEPLDLDLYEHEGIETPHFRATIRKGRLRLHDWSPYLLSGGPSRELFRFR
jgi:hypothetical protein